MNQMQIQPRSIGTHPPDYLKEMNMTTGDANEIRGIANKIEKDSELDKE